ncbi:MAG: hypothetical protein HZA61_03450 [Candidatus Eisenbacteria bacterium]|uniref:Uncharacterized protein n=1 Tax=Eiseniibacteriota bacterium TaxID=2212470 RepID=A0A933W261_UNCEI|nr:hypothetical protein [Candidatus Eisenbacteria bacterium]
MKRLAAVFLGALVAAVAMAQSADMKPFDLNMDRVTVNKFGGKFGQGQTFFVPSVNLVVSVHGSVWAQKGGAQAHAKFHVAGLDKELMRGLAMKAQQDFVAKMRAAGYKVLTYDDLKDDPAVAGKELDKDDETWGFPIRRSNVPYASILVAPTAAQQFNNPVQGPAWLWKGLAKDRDLVVLVPEITYTVPQMYAQTSSGYAVDRAGVAQNPAMKLVGAAIWSVNPKGGTPNILVQEHGMRLAAESAGTITQISEDHTTFSSEWKRASGDYVMTIDPKLFSDGVLRVAFAINSMVVAEVQKANK